MPAFASQILRPIVLLVSLIWLLPAQAVVVEGLYSAEVPVTNRTEQARSQALTQALSQAVIKITGNSNYLANSSVQLALQNPEKYLEAYGYSSNDDGETLLKARFSQSTVQGLLAQSQIPVWPANRPKVLIWLVSRDFQTGVQSVLPSTLLGEETSPLYSQIKSVSAQMGLPVVTPLMDLEDQLQAQPEQLWALDGETITRASKRYGVDHILVGRVTSTSAGQWRIGWWYWQDQTFEVFNTNDIQLREALSQGLNEVTGYLSRIYAVNVTSDQGAALDVTITGINEFGSYAATLNYLDQMALVQSYQLHQVNNGELIFTLYLNGDLSRFENALALDKKLAPVTVLGAGQANRLQLRWINPTP